MIGENPIIVVDLKEKSMDIRIGFVDSGRELAITGVERVSGVSVSQQIAFVEVDNDTPRTVGFAG